jgi:hypothetical protein
MPEKGTASALQNFIDAHPLIFLTAIIIFCLVMLAGSVFEFLTFCGLYDWISPLLRKKRGKK